MIITKSNKYKICVNIHPLCISYVKTTTRTTLEQNNNYSFSFNSLVFGLNLKI